MAFNPSGLALSRLSSFLNRMEILHPAERSKIGIDQIVELNSILRLLDPELRIEDWQPTLSLLRVLYSAAIAAAGTGTVGPPAPPSEPVDLLSFGLATNNGVDTSEYFVGVTDLEYSFTALGDGIILSRGDTLQSVSFPDLASIGNSGAGVDIHDLPALLSADFSSLVRWKKKTPAASVICGIHDCPLLHTLALSPSFTVDVPDTGNNEVYNFSNNDLLQATVDFILVRAAATMTSVIPGGTQLQILLHDGTNAAPSAAGLAAKATLVARNVTVTNN